MVSAARTAAAMLTALALASVAVAEEIYRRAEVGADGRVRIVTADGRDVIADKRQDQVGVDHVAVAPDGRAVGWLPLYPNCCTSYPIPHGLVMFTNGRERELRGNGLPVWRWRFVAGGAQVAFQQETVCGTSTATADAAVAVASLSPGRHQSDAGIGSPSNDSTGSGFGGTISSRSASTYS